MNARPGADPQDSDAFEALIAELSARFIELDLGALATELEWAQAAVGGFMGVDRCFIFRLSPDRTQHEISHVWTADGIDPDPEVHGAVIQQAFRWLGDRMLAREEIIVPDTEQLPPEAAQEQAYCRSRGIRSFLMCPIHSRDEVTGTIGIDAIRTVRDWTPTERRRLRIFGTILGNALLRRQKAEQIHALTEKLEAENALLREETELATSHDEIIGASNAIRAVLALVEQVAPSDASVLLLGETGTGKDLLARAIHRLSPRSGQPFVSVNCAALSPTLIESELFGREKGAYTGAINRQVGRFELANHSTLFLDEVGELPLELQAKLLRTLQSGEFERLGSPRTLHSDVRLVAATNRDLSTAVKGGDFREDLYYRLNVFPITVPPLRERPEDIPMLVWAFIKEFEPAMGRRIEQVPKGDLQALARYPWPGNVRELRNVVERGMILSRSGRLRLNCPSPTTDVSPEEPPMTLAEVERAHLLKVLERSGWRVRGERGAAEVLDLKPTTLESRMKKLGIRRP